MDLKIHRVNARGTAYIPAWVGDSSKVLLLEEVVKTIKENDLLTSVKVTGEYLQAGLAQMEVSVKVTGEYLQAGLAQMEVSVKGQGHR